MNFRALGVNEAERDRGEGEGQKGKGERKPRFSPEAKKAPHSPVRGKRPAKEAGGQRRGRPPKIARRETLEASPAGLPPHRNVILKKPAEIDVSEIEPRQQHVVLERGSRRRAVESDAS